MKKRKRIFILLLVLLCVAYYLLFGSPLVDWRNEKLVEATNNIATETVTLEELVPFAWDTVYIFEPYESKENIAKTLGFYSVEMHESWNDSDNWYYFVKGNRIVANLENSLWGISLPNNGEGSSVGSLHYGDNVLFEVDKSHTGRIYLKLSERGTVETFEYQDLKLQISNVHSIRVETYIDAIDPTYQWDCAIFTYYPGAMMTVLDIDMQQGETGMQSSWALEDKLVRYAHNDNTADYWLRLCDDMYPITLSNKRVGVLHTESKMFVLKFEQYKG